MIRVKSIIVAVLLLAPLFLSGCVLEQILDDIVNEHPHAVIEASPREGSAPLEVNFNAQFSRDDGTIIEYRWSFSDPVHTKSVLELAPTHTFIHPGTYLVKLTVIDDKGAVDSQQVAIVVTDAPPVARATVDNNAPRPGETVRFSATESYDLHGHIVSYEWDFGDGSKTKGGETASHTYIDGGDYVVKLTVTDESGNKAQARLEMNVLPGHSQCGGDDDDQSCGSASRPFAVITSKFFSCGAGGKVGEAITFDGTASRPAEGSSILSYHWDFGDGNKATGVTVSHVYTRAWAYVIKLTVVDKNGSRDEAIGTISIGAASCS